MEQGIYPTASFFTDGVRDFREITDHFKRNLGIYIKLMLKMLTDYAQNFPLTLLRSTKIVSSSVETGLGCEKYSRSRPCGFSFFLSDSDGDGNGGGNGCGQGNAGWRA